MDEMNVLRSLRQCGVVPVVTLPTIDLAVPLARVLRGSGYPASRSPSGLPARPMPFERSATKCLRPWRRLVATERS
jgi:hypothetical protein